jgi:hypothetical protein
MKIALRPSSHQVWPAHDSVPLHRGRSEIDDAAAALIVFALVQPGLAADASARSEAAAADGCYASHSSKSVMRYNVRKLSAGGTRACRDRL